MTSGLRFDDEGYLHGFARGMAVRRRHTVRTMPLVGPLVGRLWHWTGGYGSTVTLARLYEKGPIGEPSFHFGLDTDGSLTQLVPITLGANHCRGRWRDGRLVNACFVGIEAMNIGRLMQDPEGRWRQVLNPHRPVSEHVPNLDFVVPPGDVVHRHGGHWHRYTEAQVETAQGLCDALVEAGVPAFDLGHADLDPTRKADPGPLWMRDVIGAGRLLAIT
jgi:N-acetyl-anhydromuramyl-L-alanine amidase AmpD